MDIKQIFEDPRLVMLEQDMAWIYDNWRQADDEKHVMKHLLERRHSLLGELNVYDDEMKGLLVEFNEALRKACRELYRRAVAVYKANEHQEVMNAEDFEVEGKIYLGYDYPELHPIQTETAKMVWELFTEGEYSGLYQMDGCAWQLRFTRESPPEEDEFQAIEEWLGMEDGYDNWNENLDEEWSKGMHLIHPFHNLYVHCNFSLYDLIYVRTFHLEVHTNLEGDVSF